MKKLLLSAALFAASFTAFAQVGIGNTDPKATLDISGVASANPAVADGIIAPRITIANLTAKDDATYAAAQVGTIIYVTDVSGGTNTETANVTAVGYYYFTGTVWQPFTAAAVANKFVDGTTATDAVYTGGNVGIGTVDPLAALEIKSNATEATAYISGNGVLVPRFDVLPAVAGADEGELVYLNGSGFYYYTGTTWTDVANGYGQCRVKVSPTAYKTFLCHNLGADTSTDPHTPQIGNQGAYIQWGKKGPLPATNEDVRVAWLTAANDGSLGFAQASTTTDNNEGIIMNWSNTHAANSAWNADENSPVKVTANDPCPDGYRVPTRNEWLGVNDNNTVSRTGTFQQSDTNHGSALHYGPDANTKLLTLPAAGSRASHNGGLFRGSVGYYWSSTEKAGNDNQAYYLDFSETGIIPGRRSPRTNGFSVRCIAE